MHVLYLFYQNLLVSILLPTRTHHVSRDMPHINEDENAKKFIVVGVKEVCRSVENGLVDLIVVSRNNK
jgi:hypothetical protein